MRLRKRVAERPIDPCLGDPGAVRLRAALVARDWPAARATLDAADHPDDRGFYLGVCGSVPDLQEWIAGPARDDDLAQLVRGCHAVDWAWAARGHFEAKYTAREQFDLFFERLRLAESYLYEAAERNPDDACAWVFLLHTARGLQLGLDDARFRFEQAVGRHPDNLGAHDSMMQMLCEKWHGSHDQMFAFARRSAAASPVGSMIPSLVALAHLELMIELPGNQRFEYMRRPDVIADLRAAAGHSIWHPAAEFRPGWPQPLNTFAMAFTMSSDRQAAASVFQRLGDLATDHPWGYLGGRSEWKAFEDARKWALAG
jgi:hypothetical protein